MPFDALWETSILCRDENVDVNTLAMSETAYLPTIGYINWVHWNVVK